LLTALALVLSVASDEQRITTPHANHHSPVFCLAY